MANYCKNDSDLTREQKRIEKELTTFEDHVWGADSALIKKMQTEQAIKDSLENAAAVSAKNNKVRPSASTKSKKDTPSSNSSRSQTKRQKSSGTTYSVRRQRH